MNLLRYGFQLLVFLSIPATISFANSGNLIIESDSPECRTILYQNGKEVYNLPSLGTYSVNHGTYEIEMDCTNGHYSSKVTIKDGEELFLNLGGDTHSNFKASELKIKVNRR